MYKYKVTKLIKVQKFANIISILYQNLIASVFKIWDLNNEEIMEVQEGS